MERYSVRSSRMKFGGGGGGSGDDEPSFCNENSVKRRMRRMMRGECGILRSRHI